MSYDSLDEFEIQTSLEKMKSYDSMATMYYQSSEVIEAAKYYEKALIIAEKIDSFERITHYQRWCGACYYEGGQLKKALSILIPILKKKKNDYFLNEDLYISIIKYIEIAQELPVPLYAIKKAYKNIDNLLESTSNTKWRHMQLKKESELYKVRGNYNKALQIAQESWSIYDINNKDTPGFLPDEYLYNLSHLYLLMNNNYQAEYVMKKWEAIDSYVSSYKEMTITIRLSELERIRGNLVNAINLSRNATIISEITKHHWRLHCSINSLVRALICSEHFDLARNILHQYSRLRFSESLHQRYKFHLLRGDYYLAYCRHLTKSPSFDDEFGIEIPSQKKIKEALFLDDEISKQDKCMVLHKFISFSRHARQAYYTAGHIGKKIDELLESTVHQKKTTERLNRLANIKSITN